MSAPEVLTLIDYKQQKLRDRPKWVSRKVTLCEDDGVCREMLKQGLRKVSHDDVRTVITSRVIVLLQNKLAALYLRSISKVLQHSCIGYELNSL